MLFGVSVIIIIIIKRPLTPKSMPPAGDEHGVSVPYYY